MLEQPGLEILDLVAGIAQAGEFDDRLRTEPKTRAGRQAEQVDVSCRNVLAQLAGANAVALLCDLVEQLCLDQMNLPQVRKLAEPFDVVEMLIRHAGMRVAFDAEIRDQPDGVFRRFAERVPVARMHAYDRWKSVQVVGSDGALRIARW